jgi:hypothetical protein
MARHLAQRRWAWWRRRPPAPRRRRPVELVEAGTLLAHFLTREAHDAGYEGRGYVALCGAEVLPAAMVEPGRGYCALCLARAA